MNSTTTTTTTTMMKRIIVRLAFVVTSATCLGIQVHYGNTRSGENNIRSYFSSTDHYCHHTTNRRQRPFATAAVVGVGAGGEEVVIAPMESSGEDDSIDTSSNNSSNSLFEEFCCFLKATQQSIIQEIESTIEKDSRATFCYDAWGTTNVDDDYATSSPTTGGITRVLQGGNAIEKGACSLTIIRHGVLTAERAANIRSRQELLSSSSSSSPSSTDATAAVATDISSDMPKAGDKYSAAALSMVLHSRNPLVPTFRSDVRIFQVTRREQDSSSSSSSPLCWFGGGADLTPYYLHEPDIRSFHQHYYDLCSRYDNNTFDYRTMKQACDDYFYLPARSEHRGTGGIFFDDVLANDESLAFVQDVAKAWMPSWVPIVQQRNDIEYTEEQKYWQKLRRGRYLEFNLLYDRGVKFGLQTANPRVEGVMVSAPPEIAYAYNHGVAPNSPEAKLVAILQKPISWIA